MPPRNHSPTLQRAIEEHTHDLARTEEVKAAREAGLHHLREAIPYADAASLERLPEIADEITLNALVGLADGYTGEDLPRLIMRAPRELAGRPFGGNRGLHDNPDTFYRLIPLDDRSDFILEGHASDHPATILELSALTSAWHTLGNLTREDLGIAPGSRFRIHCGPRPSPECDHFIELSADAEMLLLRETLADWAKESPCRLTIENRVDRGGARASDDAAQIGAAAARVKKWFSEAVRLTEVPLAKPANFFPDPVISGEHGKLVTMAYSIGHFHVRQDEALVLTIDPGDAKYVGVPITNLWGTTNGNLDRSASLNSVQAENNADGTFTAVLSHEDPGVANWLDPDGLERGFLFLRWAGLDPDHPPLRIPALTVELVRSAALAEHLQPSARRLQAADRQNLEASRKRDHALRFKEFRVE